MVALALSAPHLHAVQPRQRFTLIELDRARSCLAVPALAGNGGVLLSRELAIWRVRSSVARRVLPSLERDGLVRLVEPDRPLVPDDHLTHGDSLLPNEWWLAVVGADKLEPPGPGIPVTVIDLGLDVTHPEFAERRDTILLNAQDPTDGETPDHGTAVSSVLAAPANGIGVVGVYPQALLREWDAGASLGDVIEGIDAASTLGAGVINISLGSRATLPGSQRMLEQSVNVAFRRGSLIVAAVGNERAEGNPGQLPASLPHVLTVAATDQQDAVAGFSNISPSIDLAAPGQGIPVAVPTSVDPSGFRVGIGTSFATPIVAGAAAWVWTLRPELRNTQLFDLLRFTARDIGAPGFDSASGFGLLDVGAALAAEAPPNDPQEPNDDADDVTPNGLFLKGTRPLTGPGRPRASLEARLDRAEDPVDVYRVWVPARSTVVVTLTPSADVNLELWQPSTVSVLERGQERLRDRLGRSAHPDVEPETVSMTNRGTRGQLLYVDAFLGRATRASYTLTVTTRR